MSAPGLEFDFTLSFADVASSAAPTVAPTVVASSPNIGFFDGGQLVTIQVTNSAGCTSASVAGVALTGFAIVDGTHVRGTTGIMARGTAQAVAVTNPIGTGSANLWETFNPTAPPGASATCVTYYTARHCTQVAGTLTAMPDSKGANPGIVSNAPTYTAANAAYNGLPTFDFPNNNTSNVATTNAGTIAAGARSVVSVSDAGAHGGASCYRWSESVAADELYYNSGNLLHMTSDDGTHNVDSSPSAATPRVTVCVLDGSVAAKLYDSAQTPVSGNAGAIPNLTGRTLMLGNYAAAVGGIFSQDGSTAEWLLFAGALSLADADYLAVGYGKICNLGIGA